jgi:hypothetical protein
VFVANPEKPADIAEILSLNKARLIAFLRNFQNEKGACRSAAAAVTLRCDAAL